jgi:hypothetical protein
MGENVEPVGPDGKKLLRRGRENRNFWDHPNFQRQKDGERKVFNRPLEGQFVDRNRIPIAYGDRVEYIGHGQHKGKKGVVVGRQDQVARQNGVNRDYVRVRFEDGTETFLVSRNFKVLDEDTDWRFLVDPNEDENTPDAERRNLPAGFDWDDVRRGEAPKNTKGPNGELRGEGRNQNNIPAIPGADLAMFERHALEGHIADHDKAIIHEGDIVEHIGEVGKKRGLTNGVVIGKELIVRKGKVHGYYVIVRWDNGVETKSWSAKKLRVKNDDKFGRNPADPAGMPPVLKKGRASEGVDGWVPDAPENNAVKPDGAAVPKKTAQNMMYDLAENAGLIIMRADLEAKVPARDRDALAQVIDGNIQLRDMIDNAAPDEDIAAFARGQADLLRDLGDRVRKNKKANAPVDDQEPAMELDEAAAEIENMANLLDAPKKAPAKWNTADLEPISGALAGDVLVGDYLQTGDETYRVTDIVDSQGGKGVNITIVDSEGNPQVMPLRKETKLAWTLLRPPAKNAPAPDGPQPFIPRQARLADIKAGELKVGDFVPTKNGNYGRVTKVEISERNGAAHIFVQYEDGREWDYWATPNRVYEGVLRVPDDAQAPEPPKPQPAPEPPAPAGPVAPPANMVVDRAGEALAIGQKVRHNNAKKAADLGEGVIEGFEKDPKYGKDVVKVRFPDGSLKRFRADRVFGVGQGQGQQSPSRGGRPASDFADVLDTLARAIPPGKGTNIREVLDSGGSISDLDNKSRTLIQKQAPALAKTLRRAGEVEKAKQVGELLFEITKAHIEKNPPVESLGIGEELFQFNIDRVIDDIKKTRNFYQAGMRIPVTGNNGNATDWEVETLNMGAIGFTFFMIHKPTGQRFIVKKEKNPSYAAKEVIGAAVARGLGIPGATYAVLHPNHDDVSIQTFAGINEPLKQPAKIGRSMGLNDWDDVPVDGIVKMGILDGLIDNGDRHGGNYLFGEIESDGERAIHVYPIDMGLGRYDRTGGIQSQTRYDGLRYGKPRLADMGEEVLDKIAKMSLQELIQYLQRYAGPGVSSASIRKYAQRVIDRAREAQQQGLIPGRTFGI